ncbi:MAG: hypothetical protein LBQ57_05025, partial [Spirochaetales bacterium]|nr:hypothetical protein [Spirochaetales bacterium]
MRPVAIGNLTAESAEDAENRLEKAENGLFTVHFFFSSAISACSKLDPQISMRNINREVEKVEKGKKKKEKPWYFLFLSQILQ